jgi:hypothetical protein
MLGVDPAAVPPAHPSVEVASRQAEPCGPCQVGPWTTVARAATDAVSRLSPRHRKWLTLFAWASAGNDAEARSAVRGARSGAGSAGLGVGASGPNGRRMRMSLGTPVADSPPLVDARPPIEADMAGRPQTRSRLSGLPFLCGLLRGEGRMPTPVPMAERSWGRGRVPRSLAGRHLAWGWSASDDTRHRPGLAGERQPDRPVADASCRSLRRAARSGGHPGLIDNEPSTDERRRL